MYSLANGHKSAESILRSSRMFPARLPHTPRHCQARLLWYRENVDWRAEWRSVVFSDESLYASDGRARLRHRLGERHLPECICPLHTGLTSVFIVWGPSVKTLGHIW